MSTKMKISQIFTPDYLADFMVKNITQYFEKYNTSRNRSQIKVLEPCSGEGVFLHSLLSHGFSNIVAYELDPSLELKLKEKYPEVSFRFQNFLGSEEKEEYDLIIGNPPYLGQNYNSELFQTYRKRYVVCDKYFVGNMDLFYYFIHLGIEKLKPGGFLSFITTNYWITKSEKTGIKYLKPHLLDKTFLLEYIDLSNLILFERAKGQHNCIFILQKKHTNHKPTKEDIRIRVIKCNRKKSPNISDREYNSSLFQSILNESKTHQYQTYISALTNQQLNPKGLWNLLYPKEIQTLTKQIEKFCMKNDKETYLKDYFIIRNGLIFVKDQIFILKEGRDVKIENDDFFIKIKNKFYRLSSKEKERLKKIYKSRSIKKYGYDIIDYTGYAIFLNESGLEFSNFIALKQHLQKSFPLLVAYFQQYETELKQILINAKENPMDIYFPRRGHRVWNNDKNYQKQLVDLESFYQDGKKIFFPYISQTNVFGYTSEPYYATSDTYFLWKKNCSQAELDYVFLMAYLNSIIANFIFKAKNIVIKRSKTKLEKNLPIPNLQLFKSQKKKKIVSIVRILSRFILSINSQQTLIEDSKILDSLEDYKTFIEKEIDIRFDSLKHVIESQDKKSLEEIIDDLLIDLFDLSKEKLQKLVDYYYQ